MRLTFAPEHPAHPPQRRAELAAWMRAQGANGLGYSIQGEAIAEGFILQPDANGFGWFFTERGQERLVEHFADEAAAVRFAFAQIAGDAWAFSHLLCLTPQKAVADRIEQQLLAEGLDAFRDVIPLRAGAESRYHRVFGFGVLPKWCVALAQSVASR